MRMEKPIIFNAKECSESRVEKGLGHEIIVENNELYCGKLLVFKKILIYQIVTDLIQNSFDSFSKNFYY